MCTAKEALRRQMRAIRDGIDRRSEKDCIITQKMIELVNSLSPSSVFCYVSIRSEVDTRALIGRLYGGGRALYVPYTAGGRMTAVLYEGQALRPDGHGNLAGLDLSKVTDRPALTLVPLTAFTRDCRRLGYGAGCYDRFLAGADTLSVGLGFDEQLVADIETEPHDRPLDLIVTPKRTYQRPDGKPV